MKNDLKKTHFRTWKSGKSWLYAASVLAVLVGSTGIFAKNASADITTASSAAIASSSAASTAESEASSTPSSAVDSSATTTADSADNNPAPVANSSTTSSNGVVPAAPSLPAAPDVTETLTPFEKSYNFTPSVTASDGSAVTVSIVDSTGKAMTATNGVYALPVGIYTVTYTDDNASNSPVTQTVTVMGRFYNTKLVGPLLGKQTNYKFTPGITVNDGSTVTVTVVDSAGKVFTATDGSYSLPAGTYTVTSTDSNPGSIPFVQTLTVLPAPTFSVPDVTEILTGTASSYNFTPDYGKIDSQIGSVTEMTSTGEAIYDTVLSVTVVDSSGHAITSANGSYELPAGVYTVTYTDSFASNSPVTQTVTILSSAEVAPANPSLPDLTEQASSTSGVYNFVPAAGNDATVVDSNGDSRAAQPDGSFNLTAGSYIVTYKANNSVIGTFTLTVTATSTSVDSISEINLGNDFAVNLDLGQNHDFSDLQSSLLSIIQQYLESNYPTLAAEIAAGHLNAVPVLSSNGQLSILSNNVNVNKAGTYQVVYGLQGLSLTYTVGDPQNAWTFNIDNLTLTRTVTVKSNTVTSKSDSVSSSENATVLSSPQSDAQTSNKSKSLPETGASDNSILALASVVIGAAAILASCSESERRRKKLAFEMSMKYEKK